MSATGRHPHRFLDAALDAAPDGVLALDGDGRVLGINAAAEQLLGAEGAERLAATIVDRLARSDAEHRRFELAAAAEDGSSVPVEVDVVTAGDQPARHTAWIREWRFGRAEAERREHVLRAAEQLAQVGRWDWVPHERSLAWSDELFRILGLEPREITPTADWVLDHTHPDDRERVAAYVSEQSQRGEIGHLEYRLVRPDGVVRHLRSILAIAERRDDGSPYRLVGWVQDVTERRRAEQEIAAHAAVAEALAGWDGIDSGGRRLLAGVARAMRFDAGVLWVPHGDVLVPRVQWPEDAPDLAGWQAETCRTRLPRGVGLPGRVWERRTPIDLVRIADAPTSTRWEVAAREGLRGAVAVPAISAGDVLAVLEIVSREEAELTDRLMRSLTGIGTELGQFLARRRGELDPPPITARELEVLRLAAQGCSARQCAERLSVSPATVRTHLENLYPKLGVSDKASAVATALRLGLID